MIGRYSLIQIKCKRQMHAALQHCMFRFAQRLKGAEKASRTKTRKQRKQTGKMLETKRQLERHVICETYWNVMSAAQADLTFFTCQACGAVLKLVFCDRSRKKWRDDVKIEIIIEKTLQTAQGMELESEIGERGTEQAKENIETHRESHLESPDVTAQTDSNRSCHHVREPHLATPKRCVLDVEGTLAESTRKMLHRKASTFFRSTCVCETSVWMDSFTFCSFSVGLDHAESENHILEW